MTPVVVLAPRLETHLSEPTPAQRAALRTVRTIGRVQAAELALRQLLRERITARTDLLAEAYYALHLAYGGKAPLALLCALEEGFAAIQGDAPSLPDGEAS